MRCKKIRYFSDRRFKRLIGPPPPYASPALASGEAAPFAPSASPQILRLDPDSPPATANATTPKPPRQRHGRRATPREIEQIEELTLADFDVDLDQVVLPQKADGERLTTDELDAAVESFIAALRER